VASLFCSRRLSGFVTPVFLSYFAEQANDRSVMLSYLSKGEFMSKILTETEREMVRLAEDAAQAGKVRRIAPWALEPEIKPEKKGRGWRGGRPRKVLVTVCEKV
jgi:hypothetical protein